MMRHYAASALLLAACAAIQSAIYMRQTELGQAPLPEKLRQLPAVIVDYQQAGPDANVDEATKAALETSSILIRNYASPSHGALQLTIVYAGATRRSLHFPEVCLVGEGWEIREQKPVQVGFSFRARRLMLVSGNRQQAVLYWFKTGDRVAANYFTNAYYWALEQMLGRTPSSAMVRLATIVGPAGEEAAFRTLEDFAWKVNPYLLEHIP